MAMQCEICGKKTVIGRQISHSHRVTPRKFKVNLHTRRAKIDGKIKKVRVCTKCLRKLEVV
ncbi:MAG: 50S ribosomal protein L28 [candidate division WOR-3 bacterium]